MNLKLVSFLLICVLVSCKQDKKSKVASTAKQELIVPVFDKDSAHYFVRKQLQFGPRIPNTEAHRNCAAWFIETFKRFGAEVIEQKFQVKAFDGTMLNGINVIAQINPAAKRRILLGAHWDTRPWSDYDPDPAMRKKSFDSADDGPSAVAVLMELARVLQSQALKTIGVDIVLFDLEDYGVESTATKDNTNTWGLGSQYWSRNLHVPGYRPMYGVLLDMVGGAYPGFYTEDYSVHFAKDIVEKVWNLAESEGYGASFPKRSGGGVIDDHYFVNTIAKIPMINIINRPDGKKFPHYHHTQKDNLDVIDPYTLQMVGKLMVKLLYREDSGTI
jgi:glutaminyl-peptide cyclotransferase